MTVSRFDIIASGLCFPEGPVFDWKGNLWWSEIEGGALWCRTCSGDVKTFEVGGKPNGLAFHADGSVFFCDGARGEVRKLNPENAFTMTVASGHQGPNDLAFDSAGNLVFTCPGNSRVEPTGYVACLAADGKCTVIADGLMFPNGLAFANNCVALVIAETYGRRLWCGDWDATARKWLEPQILCETTEGPNGPDGIAIGDNGLIYTAIYGSGCIDIFRLDGTRAGCLATPGSNPTNCAFDPSGKLGLVVTEAERGQVLSFPQVGNGLMSFVGSD